MSPKRRVVSPSPPRRVRPRIAGSSSLSPGPKDCLANLPVELVLQVLEHLPDFASLLSAIVVCQSIYRVYERYGRLIPLAIFRRQYDETEQDETKRYDISRVFWELVFAIRHPNFVEREIVEKLYTIGWEWFRGIDLEELLLPLGRELARSYCLDKRKEEAVKLLDKIAYGREPFDSRPIISEEEMHPDSESLPIGNIDDIYRAKSRQRWPRVTLLPVFDLLSELTNRMDCFGSVGVETRNQWLGPGTCPICLAEIIEGGELRVFPLPMNHSGGWCMNRQLPVGIRFDGGRAIVGLFFPGRIPFVQDEDTLRSLLEAIRPARLWH
ncbi:hypothetical protein VTK56DRAFT_6411 [Thermocarpiscus australiensis]